MEGMEKYGYTKKVKIPPTPKSLGKCGESFWKKINKEFLLESHHLELLKQACEVLEAIEIAEEEIKDQGRYVFNRFGEKKENPAVADSRQLKNLFRLLCRELNLDGISLDEKTRPPRKG